MKNQAKIKEYTVAFGTTHKSLSEDVNRHIEEGWEPLGGVSVGAAFNSWSCCQAMIKRHDIY